MADKLEEYRRKRTAAATPEPFGGQTEPQGPARRFVVQKHAARRLHWDFRLELGGVLVSWAVPRGPSYDPAEKRMAVHVEDHPLEYIDFEGVIPKGNYGAGEVVVWDQGTWIDLEDAEKGLQTGKLLFELRGFKLRGLWTLVRTKRRGQEQSRDWLLIKHQDQHAVAGDVPMPQDSIFTGRTIEELHEGRDRAAVAEKQVEKLGAPKGRVEVAEVPIMLAETADKAFSAPGWLFELKYDGFRVLASKDGEAVKLFYRRGHDAVATYPDVARAIGRLPFPKLVLDAEIVVCDELGRPNFQRLQKRAQLSRRPDIERAVGELPAALFVFDVLQIGERDLRKLPLASRKDILRGILPSRGVLRFADHIEEQGEALFDEVRKLNLEGILAKKADAPYRRGRSGDWLKIKVERRGDFVIVGFTEPEGARNGIGSLQLAVWEDGGLVYCGGCGTGFSEQLLNDLRETLEPTRRKKPACTGALPTGRGYVWVEPRLCCEVRYKEFTEDTLLRMAVFLGLRPDKNIEDCVRGDAPAGMREPLVAVDPTPPEPAPRTVALSNLDKVFWPDEGYTKGDLIAYYREIAPWLLPYLRDRPVVLTRFPDGITGNSFFQKDAPAWVPGWLRTQRIWSEETERDIDYFILEDTESLVYVANMASIPLHFWSSRVSSIAQPDWTILDLDPKEAPFEHVVTLAKALRTLCDEIEVPSYVKTSGQKGMHVLVPLGKQLTYEQSRQLAYLIAQVIANEHEDIATVARQIPARKGRVYVDAFQNGHGRTIVSPFSVRPQPGAPVSMPLKWNEVGAKLDPRKFTIKTALARMEKLGKDPFVGVLEGEPDLLRALERLDGRVKKKKKST